MEANVRTGTLVREGDCREQSHSRQQFPVRNSNEPECDRNIEVVMRINECWAMKSGSVLISACLALAVYPSSDARAQSVAQFYKGKTIEVIVGYPPGGSNDVFARFIARHMSRYIPGKPNLIIRNMPGGGSLIAANYIYNIAPKDGSILGIVSPTVPLDEKLGNKVVKYKSDQFTWIGRIGTAVNPLFVWHTQPFKSWRDAMTQEITLSATGAGSTVSVYPTVLNNVVKTKFKLVMGYKGSGASMLAMERGEVAGHSTAWEALKTQHPDWISGNKIRILLQFALERSPQMPNVPTVIEIAQSDEQKSILRAVLNATEIGKPLLSTPGIPKDRVTALRRAFDQMCKDPAFKADFEKAGVDLAPASGEALHALVLNLSSIKPDLMAKVKKAYGG
jgi:tripartite-type tricarboxylate transporter receptor subunit TctC